MFAKDMDLHGGDGTADVQVPEPATGNPPRSVDDHHLIWRRRERYLTRFTYEWLYDLMRRRGNILHSPLAFAFHRNARFDWSRHALEKAITQGLVPAQRQALSIACHKMQKRSRQDEQFGIFMGEQDAGSLTSTGERIFLEFRRDLFTGRLARKIAIWNRLDAETLSKLQSVCDLFVTALRDQRISPRNFHAFCRAVDPEIGLQHTGSLELAVAVSEVLGERIHLLEEFRYRFATGQYPDLLPLARESDEP